MIIPADLAEVPLFAAVPHALRARIAARSADIRANTGEWISHEGDPAYFWTMLEGEVERVRIVGNEETQMTTFDPGEYFGEVPLMLGAQSFSAIRALRPSRLMRTDPADFHLLLTESAGRGGDRRTVADPARRLSQRCVHRGEPDAGDDRRRPARLRVPRHSRFSVAQPDRVRMARSERSRRRRRHPRGRARCGALSARAAPG